LLVRGCSFSQRSMETAPALFSTCPTWKASLTSNHDS
jgi:hypothetical protein